MKLEKSTYKPFGLEAIETASRDEIAALQVKRLKRTLENVYENVPTYRKKFDAAGVSPSDFKHLDDLEKFPFTTKQDLRENYPFGNLDGRFVGSRCTHALCHHYLDELMSPIPEPGRASATIHELPRRVARREGRECAARPQGIRGNNGDHGPRSNSRLADVCDGTRLRRLSTAGSRDHLAKQLPGDAVELLQLHLLDRREIVPAG
jgi:hypothetical protein